MKHLLIVLLSSLVVTQAQLIPGFGFDLDGRGGFSFSNPLFNGSFTPNSLQNTVDRFSRVASDIGNRVRNVARLVPTPPTVANPISNIFNRFGRGDSNVNSNSNVNQNNNGNVGDHIHRAIDSVRSGIGNAINRIPQIPPIPQIPDLGSFVSNFENLWKPIQNLISNPSQQFPVRPDQIFNRINQFLPGVSQAMKSFADFSKTALRSDFWSKIPGAVQRRIQNQIQSVRSDIENMSTAMKDMMQTMPDFTFGAGLNSTLRNQPFFFPNRSGIVHLFEWKFDDIAEECEKVLGPNGYGGVQVSPVNEYLVSAKRAWWERYQPISYEIKSRSGDEKQFSNMVKRCLKAGVRIYVDVIANHMAAPGASIPVYGTAGSTSDPAAREFPSVPFNKSHFHADCVINNYKDAANVRNCQLSSLPDLDQSNSYVREKIVNYLNRLIDLGVAGFRMDACKHMSPEDLKVIYDSLKPLNPRYFYPPMARPFIYQEVIDLGTEAVKASEYTNLGVVTEFQWGLALGEIFKGNIPTETLAVLTKDGAGDVFLPSSQALVFVDNHDNQRGHGAGGDSILTYKSKQKYIQAVAFTLATDYGIARVMSSYDFADSDQGPPQDSMQIIKSPGTADDGSCTNGWVCEHRWPEIRRMISFKNYVAGTTLDHIQSANNTFALCRGEKGFMAINNSEETVTKTFHTCLPEGKYCDIISGEPSQGTCSGTVINVGANGDATITLQKNSVVAIYLLSKIS